MVIRSPWGTSQDDSKEEIKGLTLTTGQEHPNCLRYFATSKGPHLAWKAQDILSSIIKQMIISSDQCQLHEKKPVVREDISGSFVTLWELSFNVACHLLLSPQRAGWRSNPGWQCLIAPEGLLELVLANFPPSPGTSWAESHILFSFKHECWTSQ